jgi:purine-binding chemotaxis protein CheW
MSEGPGNADIPTGEKHLIFTVLGRYYALPSKLIGEIALFDTVYTLPLMPEYVPGIINRYSTPYALIDLGLFLRKSETPRTKVLVLKEQVDKAAFLIDDVVDITDVPSADLLPVEQEVGADDITSIITSSFLWRETHVFVLDIRKILIRIISESGS